MTVIYAAAAVYAITVWAYFWNDILARNGQDGRDCRRSATVASVP